jgi:hypothetical protein
MKKWLFISTVFFILVLASAKAQNIFTYAGTGVAGYSGDGGSAPLADLYNPFGIAMDQLGNIYFADVLNNRIRKIDAAGIITTFAGTGVQGFAGDGGPATSCQLYKPYGIVFDAAGNMYICDCNNNRIRKVNTSGIITTIAGTGAVGSTGDGGPALLATMDTPRGIGIDGAGNIYFADCLSARIRKVSTTGTITTVVGTGVSGYSGDGGPAVNAQIRCAYGISFDAMNNLYFSDLLSQCIRKVDGSGIIRTVVGTGTVGFSGDGGPAVAAELNYPYSVHVDMAGNIYIPDTYNNRVRVVNTSGIISTICGNGSSFSSGDGGPAINSTVYQPAAVFKTPAGVIYVSEIMGHKVRVLCSGTCVTGINSNAELHETILLYPNPNQGTFHIRINKEISEGEFVLSDVLGRTVYSKNLYLGENEITTTELSKGLYHYSILQNKTHIQTGKIVIE